MKSLCIFALFALGLVSCKNNEKELPSVNYADIVVGTSNNGEAELADIAAVKTKWEAAIKKGGKDASLIGFEIVKGTTEGGDPGEYYMLLARTDDGAIKTASLLTLKEGKLYFEHSEDSGRALPLVVCSGLCDDGCLPVVSVRSGKKYINCTPCLDCKKHETEVR
ncbi:hypothetical protein [Flavobacterium sp.]|uniref:hypothetical protein n=1 Tax=Flavobacterium sp. TaxID=239 RepID=UPI0026052D92|nr:hypothetical protein [Flavobacterium sp.]